MWPEMRKWLDRGLLVEIKSRKLEIRKKEHNRIAGWVWETFTKLI